jgi:hypothetical protein
LLHPLKGICLPKHADSAPLKGDAKNPEVAVSPDLCIAHLKFLESLSQLREEIGSKYSLLGIKDPVFRPTEQDQVGTAIVKVREKRWQVYVARAVDRFRKWWNACVPATLDSAPCRRLTATAMGKKGIDRVPVEGSPIKQLQLVDHLPPLGKFFLAALIETVPKPEQTS